MTRPGAKQLYESWRNLHTKHQAMGRTVLQMLAHPDVTPEQVQDVATHYRETTRSLREVQERTVSALRKLQPTGSLFNLGDKVQKDRLTP
jgi:hypothetical protein